MNFCIPGNIHKGGEKFMEQNVSMGRVLSFCEWVLKFFYANLLWFVFTMLGLGVFGFMPATTALFSVTRKWIMGKTDIPIFKTFWQAYRGEFFRSNAIGLILAAAGIIIYVDLAFIYPDHLLLHVLRFVIMVFGFLFLIMLFYMFPVARPFRLEEANVFQVFADSGHIVFAVYINDDGGHCNALYRFCVSARDRSFFQCQSA